ncbi:MAG: hypothetical protein AAGU11_16230 [Syntrophobacteraceae bacterium]
MRVMASTSLLSTFRAWRRRRAICNSLDSLRRHLYALSEPGCDVDSIGIAIYRDVSRIQFHRSAEGMGEPCIWI